MNVKKVLQELQKKYPGKNIIKNDDDNCPTEILCEVEPSSEHPEYSLAVSIIDKSIPHSHKKTKETYKVIKGKLKVYKNSKEFVLNRGDEFVVNPGETHWAKGNETWVECYSEPGWVFEDHILTDKSKFAVDVYDKIAEKYTQQYFDDLTDLPYIDKFLDYLPIEAIILDIGCGPGTFTQYLVKKGYRVEGADLSSEMLKIARKKIPGVKFTSMDMRKLKYPPEEFEGLLVAYSLIHIPSAEIPDALKGFYRVLKPGGSMLVIAQKGEPDKVVDEPLKKGEKIFINFFTKKRLFDFISEAGFEIDYQEELPMQDADSLSDRVIYTIASKPKN